MEVNQVFSWRISSWINFDGFSARDHRTLQRKFSRIFVFKIVEIYHGYEALGFGQISSIE